MTVTANDLDIRPLNGATDSVTLYGNRFVEDTVSTSISGTSALLVKDISPYSENSFFIRNLTAGSHLTLAVQVAPANDANLFTTITDGSGSVSGVGNFIGAVTVPARFARLQVTVSSGSARSSRITTAVPDRKKPRAIRRVFIKILCEPT